MKRNESRSWYSKLKMGHVMKAPAKFISAGLVISSRIKTLWKRDCH